MDLGSSIVDLLSIAQLANKLRKEITAAPAQYKAISEEVRSLSIVLQDADIHTERLLSEAQAAELEQVATSCTHLLEELQTTLERYRVLERRPTDLGGKLKKAWKRVAWEPEDIRDLRTRITSNITLLEALNGRIIRDNTFKLIQNFDDEERKAILNWLTVAEYASQHSDFIERREPGTGEWFLESKEYRDWITRVEPTLFSPGIPGSGKTILASIVIDDVLSRYQQDPDVGIAYIYLNFRQQEQQRLQHLLSSLLKQLLYKKPTLPESIRELHDAHVAKGTRPSISELSAALSRVAASYTSIYLVVDALDECRVADGCRQEFINQLLGLQLQTGVSSQLFATSRSIPEIVEHFEDSLTLRVRATDEDVSRFVDSSLARLSRCVRDDKNLQAEIKREIVRCVDGMFLLAQLHLDSLKGKKSRKAIRTALQNLPTGSEAYDYAYDEAMARIEGQLQDEKELAIEVLLWISSAVRPLKIAELEHALAIESGESALDLDNLCPVEELVSVCAGLVTVDQGTGIVRLVHFTTQQYFERTRDKWFPGADLKISASCVAYLLFDEFKAGPCIAYGAFYVRLLNNPFYDYAATSWGPHAKRCGVEGVRVADQLDIFKHPDHVDAMSQALMASIYWPLHVDFDTQFAKGMTGLHLAAFFGFREMAEYYLAQGVAPDLADSHARTPLCWAAMRGDLEIVKLLVSTGKVDPLKEDNNTRTPLSWAAQGGFLNIVKLFLESDYNLDPDEVDSFGWTPLCWASEYGRAEVVKLFLSLPNVNPSSKDREGRTPLSWAAKNGHLEVVRLLVEATGGANADLPDENGWTPVAWASDEGADDVIRFLVDVAGASPTSRDRTGRTPLTWAAQYGHDSTARLLMGLPGVEVSSRQDDGRTPLFWAVLYGHANVVRCLLEAAPDDGDLKDSSGRTAFSWAAGHGHVAFMQLLLDTGKVNPDSRDEENRGPMSWAAEEGQIDAIEMLLDRSDVDAVAPDTSNRIPLQWALYYSQNIAVMELLLESHAASVNWKDNSGQSVLAYAAQRGFTEAVEVLMRAEGVDINITDHKGRTPLSLAVEGGYNNVIQVLLSSPDIDVNTRDLSGKSALHHSIWASGHGAPHLLLQAANIDPDPRDNDGRTPLSYAVTGRGEDLVKLLSAVPGVDVGSRDKDGRTPLFWAVRARREDMIRALLGAERLPSDIDGLCRDDSGLSVVDWAAFGGDDKLVGILVERGATGPEDILGVQRLFLDGEV